RLRAGAAARAPLLEPQQVRAGARRDRTRDLRELDGRRRLDHPLDGDRHAPEDADSVHLAADRWLPATGPGMGRGSIVTTFTFETTPAVRREGAFDRRVARAYNRRDATPRIRARAARGARARARPGRRPQRREPRPRAPRDAVRHADGVPARPRPHPAFEGVPAAEAQDAGVHPAGGRPLRHAPHAHARGAQIARTIARALELNEDLAEAIGIGHDLGHT